jgi:hypothetical protein
VSDKIIEAFKQQPPIAFPKPQIQVLALSKELSAQIIRRSKQEGTTVHGTLCAALELASRSWKPNPIRIYSPASVRETLGIDETSSFSTIGRLVSFDKDTRRSFWETARYAKEALAGLNSMENLSPFMHFIFNLIKDIDDIDKAKTITDFLLANEYGLTNVGILPLNTDYGEVKLEGIWGPFISAGYEGRQSIGVATFNGSIRLSFTSPGSASVKPVLEFMEQILSMECAAISTLPEAQNI